MLHTARRGIPAGGVLFFGGGGGGGGGRSNFEIAAVRRA